MWFKLFTTCLIVLMCSSNAYAEYDVDNLKKLFTDKKQRVQIDAARSGNYSINSSQQTKKVSVLGYMKRSNGNSVVWVNGQNTMEGSKLGDIDVHRSNIGKNKKVTIKLEDNIIRLMPGEHWVEGAGVADGY